MNNTALKIHITGHKHPDTDSIVAAISYTELKKKLNQDSLACRLGEISHETKYILERFDYRVPMLLEDARMTLADIEIDDPIMISPNTTIYDAWMTMTSEKKPLTVVDDEDHLLGMVTNSNLTSVAMGDTAKSIELLQKTPIEYIAGTLKGELVYRPEVTRLNGKVSIIAIAEKKLENYELKDRAVIVGNDMEAQMQAIEKDAACLVVVWAESIHPVVIEKAKEKGCAIIISGHGTLNTSRYI
ncbi:MAG: DRTGG domain-containing protein, partial [Erysipelotrichaceae bacterium]